VARRYFGTDGVRGVYGKDLTPDLVERLGKAATLWADGGSMLVGRDTRASGPELEAALSHGIVEAGGTAVLAGVLPTPAVALLAEDLGAVVSASHNPPEYNGVKLFDREGRKLTDAQEEEIEALFDAVAHGTGTIERLDGAAANYLRHLGERFGSDLSGLRIAVDCANGAFSGLAPRAFEELGATVRAIGDEPDGENINVGCGATDLSLLSSVVRDGGLEATHRTERTSTQAAGLRTSHCCKRRCARATPTSVSPSTGTETACSQWTSAASPSTATRFSPSSRPPSESTSSPSPR